MTVTESLLAAAAAVVCTAAAPVAAVAQVKGVIIPVLLMTERLIQAVAEVVTEALLIAAVRAVPARSLSGGKIQINKWHTLQKLIVKA